MPTPRLTLETLLERGRRYLAEDAPAHDLDLDPEFRREVGMRALRRHGDAMRGVDLDLAEVMFAAVIGIVSWHERHAPDGRHLGDVLAAFDDAAASWRKHTLDELAPSCPLPVPFAEAAEPELPLGRAA